MSLPHMPVQWYQRLLHPWSTPLKLLTLQTSSTLKLLKFQAGVRSQQLLIHTVSYLRVPTRSICQTDIIPSHNIVSTQKRVRQLATRAGHTMCPLHFVPNASYNTAESSTGDAQIVVGSKKYIPQTRFTRVPTSTNRNCWFRHMCG